MSVFWLRLVYWHFRLKIHWRSGSYLTNMFCSTGSPVNSCLELGVCFPLRWKQLLFWPARSFSDPSWNQTRFDFHKGQAVKHYWQRSGKGLFTGLVTEAVIFLKKKKKISREVGLVVPLFPIFNFVFKEGRIAVGAGTFPSNGLRTFPSNGLRDEGRRERVLSKCLRRSFLLRWCDPMSKGTREGRPDTGCIPRIN